MCPLTLPDVFSLDEGEGEGEGTVVLRVHEPPLEQAGRVRNVVGLCPSGALTLESAD